MTITSKKSVASSDPAPLEAPPEQILTLLQLNKVAIADQLLHSIKCFRLAQVTQLLTLLNVLQTQAALANVVAYFDRTLDVKDELVRYLHDLLKMHHYITHHSVDSELSAVMMQLYGAFGDGADRQQLTKVFQTIGFPLCAAFCLLCDKLPFKLQQELLTLFAEDLPELRTWISWLVKLRNGSSKRSTSGGDGPDDDGGEGSSSPFDAAIGFFVKTIFEHCTFSWLALLRPLTSSVRLAVVRATEALSSVSLKQLARFFELTTGTSLQKYLELDIALRVEVPKLLNEFPMATLQTLFARFNSAKLINCALVALGVLPKRELLRLVDALSIAENHVIGVFVPALFTYKRTEEFTRLFLVFSTQSQLRFLDLLHVVAAPPTAEPSVELTSEDATASTGPPVHSDIDIPSAADSQEEANSDVAAWLVFDLFLDAHFNSYDTVVLKLSTLPSAFAHKMITSIAKYTPEELAVLGEGIESIATDCLPQFLKLNAALPSLETRQILVKWVQEVPGNEAAPIYDVLLVHLEKDQSTDDTVEKAKIRLDIVTKILNLITTLAPKDKKALCVDVLLRSPLPQDQQQQPPDDSLDSTLDPAASVHALNDSILRYLCDCTIALHKAIKLFRVIPSTRYQGLIFLLRTQRIAEQVALSRLMLSLPSEANCRLLDKVHSLPTETLDLFFELLLLIPQIEYRTLTKLLISPNVSSAQLLSFVQVAASLMNQASSRELVIFTAELPVVTRNLLFEMLASEPVKGVLLRIVACSSKLPAELLHQMIALLHPLSWGTRSSFVEQIRALESTEHVQDLVDVSRDLSSSDLQILVLLFNLFQLPVRIGFVTLFLSLSHQEKHLALGKLNILPKDKLQSYCTQICEPRHRDLSDAVGAGFFRVFGILEGVYQATMLTLLEKESCWSLILLMADCVAKNPEPNLINGFAASLILLNHEAELLALRSVVEEALATATSLHELVLVLCHFRNPAKLLEFLKFVHHLSRFTRSTVLFRVLSKYKQTVFIYEMCRILDLDDTLFALKRLDRLWQQHHETLDIALETLSKRYTTAGFGTKGIEIKDEFCNVVLGFHDRKVKLSDDHNRLQHETRYIVPRTAQTADSVVDVAACQEDDDDYRNTLFVPSSRPISHPAVSIERHLRRAQSEDTLPKQWKRAMASYEDTISSSRESSVFNEQAGISTGDADFDRRAANEAGVIPATISGSNESESELLSRSALFALTESPLSLPPISGSTPDAPECESNATDPNERNSDDEQHRSRRVKDESASLLTTVLPPLLAPQLRHKASATIPIDTRPRSSSSSLIDSNGASSPVISDAIAVERTLSRSESAPITIAPLEPYVIPQHQKPKRYRGLAAALDDDTASEFHVIRDRGASIFRKECESMEANGPNRIRISKTLAAQSHVMAVRVQHALGKRDHNRYGSPLASPLLRPDSHTFEQAHAAMAAAAKAREAGVHRLGFCQSVQLLTE